MPIRYEDYLAKLPDSDIEAVKEGGKDLIWEEATLRQIRKFLAKSQQQLAAQLNVEQSAVSKIERRDDICVSTLRNYIEAMGGELIIKAKFPGKRSFTIKRLGQTKHDE